MINFEKKDFAFLVHFEGAQHYLQDGVYSFPVNSLTLIIDESGMATFRKASNNDVVFSQLIDQIQFDGASVDKNSIYEKFAETCTAPTGGGGGDPETTVVDVELSQDGTEMDFVNESGDTVYSVDMTQYLVDLHVTGATLSGETLILYIAGSEPVQVNLEHMLDDYYTQDETDALLDDKLDTTRFESAEQAIANALADIYDDIVELSAHTATTLVAGDNITISGDVISANQVIELTQAEYDALSGDVDPSKFYVITDAPSVDLSDYTLTSTTAALSSKVNTISGDVATKQDQLIAGSGITITNNVISAQADMSNFYTKQEVDNAEQATSAALNDLNLRVIELSGDVATKAEVLRMTTQEYEASSGSVQSNQVVIITDATEVDMSLYATKQYVDDLVGQINQRLNQINGA